MQRVPGEDREDAKAHVPPGAGPEGAGLLNRLFFLWTNPLVNLSNRRPLEDGHLWNTPPDLKVRSLLARFDVAWARETERAEARGKSPSVMRAFLPLFWKKIIISGFLQLLQQLSQLAVPVLILQFLRWYGDEDGTPGRGYAIAAGMFCTTFGGSGVAWNHAVIMLYTMGMDMRTTLNALVYRKGLSLSNSSRQKTTVGEIVNLMATDSEKMPMMCIMMHSVWVIPIFLVLNIYLLVWLVGGAPAGAGISVMFCAIPFQFAILITTQKIQRRQMKHTDERVKIVNEVLNGIRLVKYYSWEASFSERLKVLRELEVDACCRFNTLSNINMVFMLVVPSIMTVVMLVVYYRQTGNFESEYVFSAVSALFLIRMPLMMLPMGMGSYVQAAVSLNRIKRLLQLPDNEAHLATLRAAIEGVGTSEATGDIDTAASTSAKRTVRLYGTYMWASPEDANAEPETGTESGAVAEAETVEDQEGDVELKAVVVADETETLKPEPATEITPDQNGDAAAEMEEGKGEATSSPFLLKLPTRQTPLLIEPGKLVAVVGSVGSGKSSLLSAMLQEMTQIEDEGEDEGEDEDEGKDEGKGEVGGVRKEESTAANEEKDGQAPTLENDSHRLLLPPPLPPTSCLSPNAAVAYAAQNPWIMNATLRDNITFGRPWDRQMYEETVRACALRQDLIELKAGDLTEIGEKGINLSGGQQARVSLARACYADADVYLLDDVFSAVDAHVGKHLFDECVGPAGVLGRRSTTRILCTNQLHLVQAADLVIVLDNGHISELGSPSELMAANKGFASLMRSTGAEGEDGAQTPPETPVKKKLGEGEEDDGLKILSPKSAEAATKGDEAAGVEEGREEGEKEKEKEKARMKTGELIKDEDKSEGAVSLRVWHAYFVKATNLVVFSGLVWAVLLAQACDLVFSWWLGHTSDTYDDADDEDREDDGFLDPYLLVYGLLCLATFILCAFRGWVMAYHASLASKGLHDDLQKGIFGAKMSFFDTTPTGRILNRFSKDCDAIDTQLARVVPNFLICIVNVVSILFFVGVLLPWFFVCLGPILFIYWRVNKTYRPVSRDLQRIESVSRSPIFAQLSETLHGVTTIRAYGKHQDFLDTCLDRIDSGNKAFYLIHNTNRWLQLRLELLGACIILFVALLLSLTKSTRSSEGGSDALPYVSVGMAGLLFTHSQSVTGVMNWAVRMGCETEARITSVERVEEYAELEPEEPKSEAEVEAAAKKVLGDGQAPAWPSKGAIVFNNMSMRYRPELPLVLNKVMLEIPGGSRIGIAGRTGSGKSSLSVALFRMVKLAEGSISIDGVDISTIGLCTLRKSIAIIPQDPVLFVGSLRENFDAFNEYTDADIMAAVDATSLRSVIERLPDGLNSRVAEGGENFSVGQRQLICVARAILRRPRVLVLDEATASVDIETDNLIQKMVRNLFRNCTTLTIAHRLNTIMDSDYMLIMDAGNVAEFDTPANLVDKPDSLLSSLIDNTGEASAARLRSIAHGELDATAIE